jgi:IclR family transcriptional regulator, acetate operon repressor
VGLSALAAPVYGASGEVMAALSISGPTSRLGAVRARSLSPRLLEQAHAVSERLGNHGIRR